MTYSFIMYGQLITLSFETDIWFWLGIATLGGIAVGLLGNWLYQRQWRRYG